MCDEPHYMLPYEGEVIALEDLILSHVRDCILVNSMQDPLHRKRHRKQVQEQTHREAVEEVQGSGT